VKCGRSSSPTGYADLAQEDLQVLFLMYWLVLAFLIFSAVSPPPIFLVRRSSLTLVREADFV